MSQQRLSLILPTYEGMTAEDVCCVQEVVGEGSEVLQMSEGVFVEHLADYPDMELSWLQQLYEGSTQEADSSSLNAMMSNMLIPSMSGLNRKVGLRNEMDGVLHLCMAATAGGLSKCAVSTILQHAPVWADCECSP